MRLIGVAVFIYVTGFLTQAAAAAGIDDLQLSSSDVPVSCLIITGTHPSRNNAQVFYDHGVYDDLLPLLMNKRVESFRCGKEKGTLYFFEYNNTAQREKAEVFAHTTLWGSDTKANPTHPEQIFYWDRFLMVLSFKDFQRELLEALLKRFKRLEAGSPIPS